MNVEEVTGATRCWPCTIANSIVGLLVAWLPVAAALVEGSAILVTGTVVWAVVGTGYTGVWLVKRGYLPFAESVAERTGLHDRFGPDSITNTDQQDDNIRP